MDREGIRIEMDKTRNLRYLLEVPLYSKSNRSVLVIMKNPSLANKSESDHTINNVLKYCYKENYRRIYIMNLYSFYSTKSSGIAQLIKEGNEEKAVGEQNDEFLSQVLNDADQVIAAWGSNTFGCTQQYKERIKQVTAIINKKDTFYVESVSKCGWYPKHAQVWSVNKDIKRSKWNPPRSMLLY